MPATRTTLVAALVLLLTFGAGFIGGAAAHHLLIAHRESVRPIAARAMVRRLDRHLDLSDAQRKQVEEILRRRHAAIDTIWSSARPRVNAELDAANAEIEKILTPPQREKFAKMRMHLLRHRDKEQRAPTR